MDAVNARVTEDLFRDANATRYLSLIGLVVLLYDHLLTFGDEIKFIWLAPPSFAKFAFLFNRYLVPACLITIAYEMNRFNSTDLSNASCQRILFIISMLSICSIGLANALVLMRIVILWTDSRVAILLLILGFLTSFAATLTMMVLAALSLLPGIRWSPLLNMCVTTTKTDFLPATWGSPMIFEVTVLLSVVWNALTRPRGAQLSLTKSLRMDGITFFLSLTIFRLLNLSLSVSQKSSRSLLSVFFVWSFTTLVLDHSLLNVRRAEIRDRKACILPGTGRTSPFGIPEGSSDCWDEINDEGPDNAAELRGNESSLRI